MNIEEWERKPHFEHFFNEARCTFSVTANINITELLSTLRDEGIKLYPAFLYMVTKAVNAHREFRMSRNENGNLGYWENMIPSYTFFHQDDKTFSAMWTDFSDDFAVFYRNYLNDLKLYGDGKGILAKGAEPPHAFNVSCIPWISFTGFNLNIYSEGRYLLPIITSGKYLEQAGETLLPVSLQVHHAVCDGYHAGLFINEVQEMANRCKEWLFTR
jgi:chloramphenicol O-acetyltransferase type A